MPYIQTVKGFAQTTTEDRNAAVERSRKGGKAGTGKKKRRGGKRYYAALAGMRFKGWTREEVSAEMSRRRRRGLARVAARAALS